VGPAPTRPPTRPPARLTALARRLVRLVTDRARAELIRAGFSEVRPAHNVVLAQAGASGSGARITDMADRAGVTKQAVTLMVDHLEAGGYVVRVADPSDRRAKLVVLTDRGAAAAEVSRRVAEEIERGWAELVGAGRLTELKTTLVDLIAGLERDSAPAIDPPGTGPGDRKGTG
jgi:DNA-binding MarR family transcriptional regulator